MGEASYHLAQLNIATVQAPLESPQLQDFVANLDRINGIAESTAGFIWRAKGPEVDAEGRRVFGAEVIVNLSVWRDLEVLRRFVYQSEHAAILKRRREWFQRMTDAYYCLWWVPEGQTPGLEEAARRLQLLRTRGATPEAFNFATAFPAPAPVPLPLPPPTATDLERARQASREVLGFVMTALRDARGIHLESLFCALGALAGCACQESVCARVRTEGQPPEKYFSRRPGPEGRPVYAGEWLDQPLAEDRLSIWSLVAGAAAHSGARQLPDRHEIFRQQWLSIGSGEFGVPQLPPAHAPQARPLDYAQRLWPGTRAVLQEESVEARLWPVTLGLAVQELLTQTRSAGRSQLPADLAVRLIMESAIPAAWVPLATP